MFYLIVILVATSVVAGVNFLFGDHLLSSLGFLALYSAASAAAAFVIDGIAALIVRRLLPEKWFSPNAPLFSVGERERILYRKLKINAWKDCVPELGCFTGFHKDKVREPSSSAYLARFIVESNYGVLGHVAGAILGFLVMLLPFGHPFSIGLPVALVNFVLSMLPTMILRFNTPSLQKLYQRSLRKEEKREKQL